MLTPYITFNGNTEEAFNFYSEALGGKLVSIERFGDTTYGEQMTDEDKKKIMHITLQAPGGVMLMGNDHMDFMGQPFVAGNNFSLSLHPDSEAKADQLFNGLSPGGMVIMPMAKVFWGSYFGMFIDKFGIKWLINHQPV